MQKFILLIVAIASSMSLNAQPDSIFIQKIDSLRKQQVYAEIIETIHLASSKDTNQLWYTYQLACYESLNHQYKKAFFLLEQAINLGAKGADILTDTDFENLHTLAGWSTIRERIETKYLEKNKISSNRDLAIELFYMYIEDQRYRSLSKNYKKEPLIFGTSKYAKVSREHEDLTANNLKRLKKIIKKYGWPTFSMVGKEAASGAFYLIQHAEKKYIKKYINFMKDAAMVGEASKSDYARMYDRLCVFQGKKQYYGTQLTASMKTDDSGGQLVGLKFYPIENPETINKRRKKMGLNPIEQYAKKKGVVYNPNENVEMHKY